MQFWKIEHLKSRLVSGSLPEGEQFLYFLGWVWVPFITNALPSPALDATDTWANYWLVVALHFTGLCWAFRNNGGVDGQRFVECALSIGWVMGVRLGALSLPIGFVVGAFFAISGYDAHSQSAASIAMFAFTAIYYLRVASHIKQVAASGSAAGE